MKKLTIKTGLWSAGLLIVSLIAFIVCFTGIAVTSPLFHWTNLTDYLEFEETYPQVFQHIARFFMLILGPSYVVLLSSFYDHAKADQKVLARTGLLFGIAFAVLSGMHYFIQLSMIRINIEQGQVAGIENFLQANPYSFSTAADITGWTFFLGLSSFFMFPIFNKEKLSRVIRYSFS